jgi:hypothetical protein
MPRPQASHSMPTEASYHSMSTGRLGAGDSAIQSTIVDAKGDLIVATAADTPARLAVGSANQYLAVDSSTATGLKWASLGTFTSFTPSWSGLTIGNGTTTGAYTTIGDYVYGYANLTFGSTTSVTGNLQLSFPVGFSAPDEHPLGFVRCVDTGTATYTGFGVAVSSTSTIYLLISLTNGTYTSDTNINATVPFTWTNTDILRVNFHYRKA